jgi:hypothetical protein
MHWNKYDCDTVFQRPVRHESKPLQVLPGGRHVVAALRRSGVDDDSNSLDYLVMTNVW